MARRQEHLPETRKITTRLRPAWTAGHARRPVACCLSPGPGRGGRHREHCQCHENRFRRWVVEECPVAPGRTALTGQPSPPAPLALLAPSPAPASPPLRRRPDGRPRKQDLLIALASQRHDLHRLPLNQVARIAGEIGDEVNLHQGTARRVLKAHVQALQHIPTDDRTEVKP